ncbi:hypothetical protein GQ457_09G007520 [Hibiscus cannabinus]
MQSMVAFRAEPTFPILPSSFSSNTLRYGGNNKNLHMGVKYPKCTKSISNYNMRGGKPDPDKIHDILGGRMVEEDLVFQQELMVRTSDVDSDSKLSITALSNYLQVGKRYFSHRDTVVNHFESIGLLSDGFATPEMSKRDLAWVIYKMGIAIDCYPCCNGAEKLTLYFLEKTREKGRQRIGLWFQKLFQFIGTSLFVFLEYSIRYLIFKILVDSVAAFVCK